MRAEQAFTTLLMALKIANEMTPEFQSALARGEIDEMWQESIEEELIRLRNHDNFEKGT